MDRLTFTPSLIAVIGFSLIHFFSGYLSFKRISLRKFLSFSAGVAISYVFIHLFPEMAHGQAVLTETFAWEEGIRATYSIYVATLAGLVIFYAMDRLAVKASEVLHIENPNTVDSAIFWFHMFFFMIYNAMIGYLLTATEFYSWQHTLLYFLAVGLHFVTNDWGLRHHHENAYDKYGRHLLTLAIIAGWLFGELTDLPLAYVVSIEAFVAGAMALNSIKNELPSERDGSLAGFLSGTISATILFLLI